MARQKLQPPPPNISWWPPNLVTNIFSWQANTEVLSTDTEVSIKFQKSCIMNGGLERGTKKQNKLLLGEWKFRCWFFLSGYECLHAWLYACMRMFTHTCVPFHVACVWTGWSDYLCPLAGQPSRTPMELSTCDLCMTWWGQPPNLVMTRLCAGRQWVGGRGWGWGRATAAGTTCSVHRSSWRWE